MQMVVRLAFFVSPGSQNPVHRHEVQAGDHSALVEQHVGTSEDLVKVECSCICLVSEYPQLVDRSGLVVNRRRVKNLDEFYAMFFD